MSDLVVLSGGLDSATVLGLVKTISKDEVSCVSFHYRQRHANELQSAAVIAAHYGVPQVTRDITGLGQGGVLMEHKAEMPHSTYDELKEAEGPSPTYVPFRNGTFLSLAASYALEIGADTVWVGVHADDAHNWAYPDCSPEFIGAMQAAIYVGTYHKVRLQAPFQYYTKAQIITVGVEYGVPFHLTMSCYEGRRPACGRCPTCVARREAFLEAGYNDPLEYEKERVSG